MKETIENLRASPTERTNTVQNAEQHDAVHIVEMVVEDNDDDGAAAAAGSLRVSFCSLLLILHLYLGIQFKL